MKINKMPPCLNLKITPSPSQIDLKMVSPDLCCSNWMNVRDSSCAKAAGIFYEIFTVGESIERAPR